MQEEIHEATELIEMIREDPDCSKRLKENLKNISKNLLGEEDLKIQKGIHAIEELDLQGISSYIRSQLWELISLLESLSS